MSEPLKLFVFAIMAVGMFMALLDIQIVAASLPEITADVVAEVVLPPGLSPALVKKTLQAELRRWHPDKFAAKWQGRLAAEEAGAVLERAKRVSQALNELMEKLG